MKKLFSIFAIFALCTVLVATAYATDVYVNNGGSGDGSSPASPLGSMSAAIEKIATSGGTVHIVDKYSCNEQYYEPAHTGDIVITGGTYEFTNGPFNRWFLSGPGSTTFENITFTKSSGDGNLIVANYNKLVIGEGVTFPTDGKCYIIGGYQRPTEIEMEEYMVGKRDDLDSDVTIKSGNIWCVCGFNRGHGTVHYYGTSHITVEGGHIDNLYAANVNGFAGNNGVVTVKGGTIDKLRMGGDDTRRLNGDCTVNMHGGEVTTLLVNNVLGTATLNYYGGKIGSAAQSMGNFGDKPDTSKATSVLNATMEVDISTIASGFDNINTIEKPSDAPSEEPSDAPTVKTEIKLTIGNMTGYVNGVAKTLDAAPVIKNDRTMLPVRFVAENFGATVGWDGATSAVTVTTDTVKLEIVIGSATAKINGNTVTLDAPAFIENSRTYLPVRFVAENLGATVEWDAVTRTATLTKSTTLILDKPETPNENTDTLPELAGYHCLSKEEYLDKTTAGFLSQIAGFFSGYEFVRTDGKLNVGMPDNWYKFLAGPYAVTNPYDTREPRLRLNTSTRLWETWMDDDFSIDILDQYILQDMYKQYGTVTSKVITDGWVNYNVYDMGGGNRDHGAYAMAKFNRYLPEFCGNAEFGNRYTALTEPWIGNEMIGMDAAGMPNTAVYLADMFGSVTGDRENVEWTKFVAAMYSMAYFESDIPTLIRTAANVFGEGEYEREVIDICFEAYEKHPDDWRAAAKEVESRVLRRHDRRTEEGLQLEMNVNNSLMILGMLYGEGDYDTTCKIISLGGYDGDCTAACGMGIMGIIAGMDNLPAKVNERLWQNGKGVIVNKPIDGMDKMYWMCMLGLPETMLMSDIINMYRDNFEWILLENGGKIENGYYYIPKETLKSPDVLYAEYFEHGSLGEYSVKNASLVNDPIYEGENSLRVEKGGEAYTEISGLEVGKQYRLEAFVRTDVNGEARMFARAKGNAGVYATVENYPDYYVKRTLVFTATADKVEIGMSVDKGTFALIDHIILSRVDENVAGTVTITTPVADGIYTGTVALEATADSKKEVLLKVEFANTTGNIVNASLFVNNQRFNAAPLAKTGSSTSDNQANFVYIPIVLKEGTNKINISLGAAVNIRSVKLVSLTETY